MAVVNVDSQYGHCMAVVNVDSQYGHCMAVVNVDVKHSTTKLSYYRYKT